MNCGISESLLDDDKDRPFICPCGKSYLSYPALFTHIKQKHGGKAPGHVVRPKSQNKRGRPRKSVGPEGNSESANQRPDYKSFASRLLFNKQEQKEIGYLINQVEPIRTRHNASLDFVPPISTSHLALILATKSQHGEEQQDYNGPHLVIRKKLKEILEPVGNASLFATPSEVEGLISLNDPYLRSLDEERRSSRRPLGCDLWQMDLRTALLQFLDCFKDTLTRGQFRNLQVLIALMIYFYTKELTSSKQSTTVNYVEHLNTFIVHLLYKITEIKSYSKIYSLQKDTPLKLITLVHCWMLEQGLTDYVIQMAERSMESEGESSMMAQ